MALWEKTGTAKNNSDLRQVDQSTLAITEPTVIFITGLPDKDVETEMSKNINRVRKNLEGHPELESMPKIYSWSHKSLLSGFFNVISYNFHPGRKYTPEARDLARDAIMPLVSENGRPLPENEAKRRLRNLTFLNFCAGAVIAQEVHNASLEMMKDIGYKPEKAQELLHEVTAISFAVMSVPWKEKDRFSTLSLINSDDLLVGAKNLLQHPLHTIFTRASKVLKISSLSATSALVSAANSRRIWDWRRKREVIEGVRLPRWHLTTRRNGKLWFNFNHEIPVYINAKDDSSQISGIVPTALVNAINRTSTDPLQLVTPLQGAPEQYHHKITAALKT